MSTDTAANTTTRDDDGGQAALHQSVLLETFYIQIIITTAAGEEIMIDDSQQSVVMAAVSEWMNQEFKAHLETEGFTEENQYARLEAVVLFDKQDEMDRLRQRHLQTAAEEKLIFVYVFGGAAIFTRTETQSAFIPDDAVLAIQQSILLLNDGGGLLRDLEQELGSSSNLIIDATASLDPPPTPALATTSTTTSTLAPSQSPSRRILTRLPTTPVGTGDEMKITQQPSAPSSHRRNVVDLVELSPFDIQLHVLDNSTAIQNYELTNVLTSWMNEAYPIELQNAGLIDGYYAEFESVVLYNTDRRHRQRQRSLQEAAALYYYTSSFKGAAIFTRTPSNQTQVPQESVLSIQQELLMSNEHIDALLQTLQASFLPGFGSNVVDIEAFLTAPTPIPTVSPVTSAPVRSPPRTRTPVAASMTTAPLALPKTIMPLSAPPSQSPTTTAMPTSSHITVTLPPVSLQPTGTIVNLTLLPTMTSTNSTPLNNATEGGGQSANNNNSTTNTTDVPSGNSTIATPTASPVMMVQNNSSMSPMMAPPTSAAADSTSTAIVVVALVLIQALRLLF